MASQSHFSFSTCKSKYFFNTTINGRMHERAVRGIFSSCRRESVMHNHHRQLSGLRTVCFGTFAVTGGTGFLGAHLVAQLIDQGHSIRLLVRKSDNSYSKLNTKTDGTDNEISIDEARQRSRVDECVTRIEGSLEDVSSLESLMMSSSGTSVDGLFHLAGVVKHSRRPEVANEMDYVNVDGAVNAVIAAEKCGVKRCVIASTSGTVGVTSTENDTIPGDESAYAEELTRRWPYYASKIRMEKKIRMWMNTSAHTSMPNEKENDAIAIVDKNSTRHDKDRIETVFIRPSLLLGPGDYRLSSCGTVVGLIKREIPIIPSGGINFVDVRDAAEATIQAMKTGKAGESYLLGAKNLSTKAYFQEISMRSGSPMPFIQLPGWITVTIASVINALLQLIGMYKPTFDPVLAEMGSCCWYIKGAKAKDDLRFRPRDWRITLDDTVSWLKKEFDLL